MGSIGNPKPWVPYMNSRDCSQGFCSIYCPQWCYIIFPPPPPLEFPEDDSSPSLSPLTIAIIGILASVFLLVSYYAIISKYCGTVDSSRRRESHQQIEETDDNHDPSLHEPWQTRTTGLDEALIKSITVCKYKSGDGLIGETDCSVCLSEFQEDESIRLLPKCSHAFHVHCIDTWLKSHSNCPLCRANIIFITSSPLQSPPPVTETPPVNESSSHNIGNAAANTERGPEAERVLQNEVNIETPKSPFRGFRDSGNFQTRDTIIEIRDEGYQRMRRSVSMDHCRLSISDVLQINQVEDDGVGGAGPSKQSSEAGKSSYRKRIKRSFSSGRFFITRQGRLRDTMIPL
ncbi:hypothetical protein SLE2022_091270 [Rubroshorea leprosula]